MTKRKTKEHRQAALSVVNYQLDSLYLSLGQSVCAVEEMQDALKKDLIDDLRACALTMRERVRKLQRLQREIFQELESVGVLRLRAQRGRSTGRRVRASVDKREPAARHQ
jgi:hypothetical protein